MESDNSHGIVHAETYGIKPHMECDARRNENRNENRNEKPAGDHEGVHPLAQKWRHSGPLGIGPSRHSPTATDPRPLMKGF